jgi:hypothetical protein
MIGCLYDVFMSFMHTGSYGTSSVLLLNQEHLPPGSAGDVLEDNPVGRLKVFVYDLPSKFNKRIVTKDPRCLNHMFAAEIFMHRFLLSSAVRTLNPGQADWFYTPVYTTCDLTSAGLPLPFKSPRMMRSAIQYISSKWPFWNKTDGADHFFVVPHDFGACFHYQVRTYWSCHLLPAILNHWPRLGRLFSLPQYRSLEGRTMLFRIVPSFSCN